MARPRKFHPEDWEPGLWLTGRAQKVLESEAGRAQRRGGGLVALSLPPPHTHTLTPCLSIIGGVFLHFTRHWSRQVWEIEV